MLQDPTCVPTLLPLLTMRPRPASLTISTSLWRIPRSSTPRRATFPPKPLTSPQSPINPFLVPPSQLWTSHSLFPIACPILPASPLSIWDSPISPTALPPRNPSPTTDAVMPGQEKYEVIVEPYHWFAKNRWERFGGEKMMKTTIRKVVAGMFQDVWVRMTGSESVKRKQGTRMRI
ncbi:hypothetical protein GQ44DRAFT_706020 [Phaeosphaeriaceae sp. PMI808]|nr:hypothetical protein GQ44DRAFT_706020 [Phaeosphaeriaceae sp. PMI808]